MFRRGHLSEKLNDNTVTVLSCSYYYVIHANEQYMHAERINVRVRNTLKSHLHYQMQSPRVMKEESRCRYTAHQV